MFKRFAAGAAALSAWVLAGTAVAQAPNDADRAQARDIFARVISYDTSIEGRRTPEMAQYLAGLFVAGGFAAEDVQVIPFEHTATLVVRYRGDGSGGRPVLFLAHMDVVTAHREDWARDPFTLVEEDGFFFGRGTLDNKGGVTTLTATFLQLRAQGFTPTRDLIIVFTGDEETTGASARMLLEQHRDLVDGEFALNSDSGGGALSEESGAPLGYGLQTAEKSFASFTLTARNPGGHSSRPRADNAIYDLVDALARVRAFAFPVMWNDTTIESMRAGGPRVGGDLGAAMSRFAANPRDRRAIAALSADAGANAQIRTTCVATMLEGGHADNALPQRATATINCRIFPGITIEDVQAQLQRLAGDDVAVATLDPQYWSSDASPLRPDVLAALTRAIEANHPGLAISPGMSSGATDGVFFRAAGIPTYGVGENFIKGSDAFAHGLNERVPVASFYSGLGHWRTMITALAGPAN
jgi:acetylornithine deacetylase/succinyl-diaminopimelate desuccinylase-like protein